MKCQDIFYVNMGYSAMMFNKDYSNTGGEFLCKSCAWCAKGPINNGVYCGFDREFHVDVGVCKDYKEKNNEA